MPNQNQNETTEEAISAFLRYADFVQKHSGEITVGHDALREYASRIEVAARLERESLQGTIDKMRRAIAENTPGNAAAMRAALENVERVARFCSEAPRHTPAYPTDAARADVLYSRIAELGRVARAALSAPARNCDRPECRTEEGASATYIAEHPHAVEPDASTYGSWLLATAKGGAE